ncbi:glycosyltransferase family 4 protein [bacterium]|nr:glycosyltransferase family 4 protein [bacterium]
MPAFQIIGALPSSLTNFRGDLIRAVMQSGYQVTAMAAPGDVKAAQDLESAGVRFRAFAVQRNGLNPLADLNSYRSLCKAFRDVNPDVAMAYTIKPVIWGGFASQKANACRFFALVTGLGFAFQDGGTAKKILCSGICWLYRRSLKNAEGVIFQNNNDRDIFIKKRIVPANKCHVVNGSGVNTEKFSVSPLQDGPPRFLIIARLLKDKGIREFHTAAQIVREKFPSAEFEIVGPKDNSSNGIPIKEIQGWRDEKTVQYSGSTTDVRPYISNCHVFVLPSYYREGLPRTLLEATAMGRPILTTDTPGCRETVESGVNGFMVPKQDSATLAERMIWFIENRDQWKSMGDASRKIAEDKFDVHKVNAEMLRIMGIQS